MPNNKPNYQKLITQLLIDMNESKNVIDETYLKLDKETSILKDKMLNIINKIKYSTKKLENEKCYTCGDCINYKKIDAYKNLNTQQLNNLLHNINTRLQTTNDYTVITSIKAIIIIIFASILVNLYIVIINKYILQIIWHIHLLIVLCPLLHNVYLYRGCNKHDRYNKENLFTTIKILLLNKIPKGAERQIWSCKYANELAEYIKEQINILNK